MSTPKNLIYFISIVGLIFLNISRFFLLDISPPGFYTDEAASATQALCIAQSGYDFYGNWLPLFPKGFEGGGVFTPFYIYGEILWTSIFGSSISAFRAYCAFITCLTVICLYIFVKSVTNKQIALYAALSASIMPWAFQFSRIAWDPPLATFFLVFALAVLSHSKKLWFSGFLFAFAMYSYPPMRISVPLILVLLPNIRVKDKLILLCWTGIAVIPLLWQYLDPNFMSHAKDLAIWSNLSVNPYPQFGKLGSIFLFFDNFASHFTGTFLFNRGDANIRSSIQSVGMLSAIDKFALLSIPASVGIHWYKNRANKKIVDLFSHDQWKLLIISIIGIIASIVPAALTVEGNPHALRAIGAWPFFASLSGLLLYQIGKLTNSKAIGIIVIVLGMSFFANYLHQYYIEYPKIAKDSFRINNNPGIDYAYYKIANDGLSCEAAKNTPYVAVINQPFNFSYSNAFLKNGWHTPEHWGVWSNSISSFLLIPTPTGNPHSLTFIVSAFLSAKFPTQELDVWINRKLIAHHHFLDQEKTSISIPLDSSLKPGDNILIEFHIKQLRNPKEAGISDDIRPLGIALYSGIFN